jgi:SAM-dependent methyltransferase
MMSTIEHRHSSDDYLVGAYKKSGSSLYSHTVFNFIGERLRSFNEPLRILDLGCADGRSKELLLKTGAHIADYYGVDSNANFCPSFVGDIRDVSSYIGLIPFTPNVILITDVLEHFENGTVDIKSFLKKIQKDLSTDCLIFITVPQMYRLDRFKLAHLHYTEHKVRFTLYEWTSLLTDHLRIIDTHGIGYLSVLPYLVMFVPSYKEDGILGHVFLKTRKILSSFPILRKIDLHLTNVIGKGRHFEGLSNSVLLVCRTKGAS